MSLPELKVAVSNSGAITIVAVEGHLNTLTVGILETKLDAVLATDTRRIVVDCADLCFISSAGLRVFLSSVKRMKSRGGSCAFATLAPAVREIFEMAGFLETMEVHTSLALALASENP